MRSHDGQHAAFLDELELAELSPDAVVTRLIVRIAPDLAPTFRGYALDRADLAEVARRSDDADCQKMVDALFSDGILTILERSSGGEGYAETDQRWHDKFNRLETLLGTTVDAAGREPDGKAMEAARARLLAAIIDTNALEELRDAAIERSTESARQQEWFRNLGDPKAADEVALSAMVLLAGAARDQTEAAQAEQAAALERVREHEREERRHREELEHEQLAQLAVRRGRNAMGAGIMAAIPAVFGGFVAGARASDFFGWQDMDWTSFVLVTLGLVAIGALVGLVQTPRRVPMSVITSGAATVALLAGIMQQIKAETYGNWLAVAFNEVSGDSGIDEFNGGSPNGLAGHVYKFLLQSHDTITVIGWIVVAAATGVLLINMAIEERNFSLARDASATPGLSGQDRIFARAPRASGWPTLALCGAALIAAPEMLPILFWVVVVIVTLLIAAAVISGLSS